MIAVVPGPFTANLAASLVRNTPAEHDLTDSLTRLVHRSLLVPVGATRPGGASRFSQLATVRGHASHAAGTQRPDAVARRDSWVAAMAGARPLVGTPPEQAWSEAVDDDLAAVRATLQHRLVDAPNATGIAVAPRLSRFWYSRAMTIEARRWLEVAHAVRDVGDPLDAALVPALLGTVHLIQHRPDHGLPLIRAGLAELRALPEPDPVRIIDGVGYLPGYLYFSGARDLLGPTAAYLRRLADSAQGSPGAEHLDLNVHVGELHARLAAEPASIGLLAAWNAAHDRGRELGNAAAMSNAALRSALLCHALGRIEEGLRWSQELIDVQIANGERHAAPAFSTRALLLAAGGYAYQAARLLTATRIHHQSVGTRWPRDEATRTLLDRATEVLDHRTLERARAEGQHLTLADLAREAPPSHTGGR